MIITKEIFEKTCLEVFPNCCFKPSLCWADMVSEFAYNGEHGWIIADICVSGECRVYTEHCALDYTSSIQEFKKQLEQRKQSCGG